MHKGTCGTTHNAQRTTQHSREDAYRLRQTFSAVKALCDERNIGSPLPSSESTTLRSVWLSAAA